MTLIIRHDTNINIILGLTVLCYNLDTCENVYQVYKPPKQLQVAKSRC